MKRLLRLFVGALFSVLLIIIAIPFTYYGYLYYSGYRHGNTIEITVTPPIASARTDSRAVSTVTNADSETPVTAVQLASIVEGLAQPTSLAHAFDNRLFITEKAGVIRIFKDGRLLPDPFLDIRDIVGSEGSEQGLLSIAFHPDYHKNGRFFINYTNIDGHSLIAQYQTQADNANKSDQNSQTILLTIGQPFAVHNGGQLKFGPEGYLYISVGDGGTTGDFFNNAQNPANLLGSILRIDVNYGLPYSIPPDNPFVDDNSKRNEIWAFGLRNPWRFSFDRQTGDLFIADVGQFDWEEVNYQPAGSQGGQNYGWNILEGSACYKSNHCTKDGYVPPVAEYAHSEGGCAITGGYVYRGNQFPALRGNYFFGDFCTGKVWSLFHHGEHNWTRTLVYENDTMISSFGEDINGELYLLDFRSGAIFQIQAVTHETE